MSRRLLAAAIVVAAVGAAVAIGLARRGKDEGARCGPAFVARGARCMPAGASAAPLVATPHGLDAPAIHVLVPGGTIAVGPSDWEAEGRVAPRTIKVAAFRIDAFEATRGSMGKTDSARPQGAESNTRSDDSARAASAVTRAEAQAACATRGGRLPTEDEWIVAAVSAMNPPRRYPWGDTGAVCRRAAWGLKDGPCARGADGPDTVGAHPDGDTPLGLHDMAGNVAEWVSDDPGFAKGGAWDTALAADLRIWARLAVPPDARDPRVGFRCVYPP